MKKYQVDESAVTIRPKRTDQLQGQKQRVFKSHSDLSLEVLVPQNDFYRQVQSKLDLDFVRELVAKCYTPIGRPLY